MTRADAIRAFVKANGPCLIGAIADAFKAKTRHERMLIYWSVAVMCRDGTMKKTGKAGSLKYRYVREPVASLKMTPDQRVARRREQEALRRRKQGIPTREEFRAAQLKAVAERQAARPSAPAKPRPAPALKPKPKPKVVAKRTTPAQSIVMQPKAPSVVQVAPPKPRFETSDEWMARTGRKPEVLPAPLALKPWEPLPKQRKRAA
jgi:hypothetical protein